MFANCILRYYSCRTSLMARVCVILTLTAKHGSNFAQFIHLMNTYNPLYGSYDRLRCNLLDSVTVLMCCCVVPHIHAYVDRGIFRQTRRMLISFVCSLFCFKLSIVVWAVTMATLSAFLCNPHWRGCSWFLTTTACVYFSVQIVHA